jgi:hypothetical protein
MYNSLLQTPKQWKNKLKSNNIDNPLTAEEYELFFSKYRRKVKLTPTEGSKGENTKCVREGILREVVMDSKVDEIKSKSVIYSAYPKTPNVYDRRHSVKIDY